MPDLISRLEGLTEPCGFTDELVADETGWHRHEDETGKVWRVRPDGASLRYSAAPAVTASVDAVLELIERELPGLNWSLVGFENAYAIASIGEGDAVVSDGKHPLPAVALLIAFLRAKEMNDE
jgi:hypothetical protein